MTSRDSIDAAIRKGNMAFSMVSHLIRNEGLSVEVKSMMYKQLISPTMTYGTSVWNAEENPTSASSKVPEKRDAVV